MLNHALIIIKINKYMIEYVDIDLKDGPRILNPENEKFQLVLNHFKNEIQLLENGRISSKIIVEINNDKLRIGIDSITAEDILILNEKINEKLQIANLFTQSMNILLSQKIKGLVLDTENA